MKMEAPLLLLSVMVMFCSIQTLFAQEDDIQYKTRVYLTQISEALKLVKAYTPQSSRYLAGVDGESWLLQSVSAKAQQKWVHYHSHMKPEEINLIEQSLLQLAKAASAKLPLHKPKPANFAFRNAADEALIKAELENIDQLTIYKIGFVHSDYQRSGNNFPFKDGFIWAMDSEDDHSYCHLYQVRISQEYIGDGMFGGSKTSLLDDVLVGCP